MKPINMLDLKAEFPLFERDVRAAIDAVLHAQAFIGGPQVAELEGQIANMLGCRHAIAISSGTDAIMLALMTAGVGPGDEVITTPFTFFATAGCIHRVGARPVFVDIDPETFNVDPQAIVRAITARTRVIIPVHLFGQCAEMDAIQALARERGLIVLEDAAQAIGARYRDRSAGTLGDAGCFSFYPTKNLGGFGEGGMITTDDDAFNQRCRQLRNHGQTETYQHGLIGGNFRLDTMKAAILSVKLRRLAQFNETRRAHAALYDKLLAGLDRVRTPVVGAHQHMIYHQYSVLCDDRDGLRTALTAEGIGTGIYYPLPLHLQPCFADLGYRAGDLPQSESCARRILSLPIHPMLTAEDVTRVADVVRRFCGGSAGKVTPAKAAPVSAAQPARTGR